MGSDYKNTSSLVRKTTMSDSDTGPKKTFVWSNMRPDHYDDICGDETDPMLGWNLTDHNRNPVALLNHNTRDIIGMWKNSRIEGTGAKRALVGDLILAPAGTSATVDECRSLISAGILRACSVGFTVQKSEPRGNGSSGRKYTRMTLCEVSLCAVPANPDALMKAKSLGVSTATIRKIFKEQNKNASLADRIADARANVRYSEQQKKDIHRKAKSKLARLDTKEAKTQTERVDKAMAQARARIAAKKVKQEPSTAAEKYDWPDQDFYVWNGQRIKRRNWNDGWGD
jgi:HK97 family phage prohead protease